MAKMCPLEGCKAEPGLCIHDKMMIGMALMGLLAAAGYVGVYFL